MTQETQHDCGCINKDELMKRTQADVEKYGLQVIAVASSTSGYSPSFAYSVGLTKTYNHPELICFGLPSKLAHGIINDVAKMIKEGEVIKSGEIYRNIFKDSRAIFLRVDRRNIANYFGQALNFYEDENFEALQLVWTDRNDRFPWEEDFEEEFLYQQPLLDRNAEFKFNEPSNLATFTTRQWIEEQAPILTVAHDFDGSWQFLTDDPNTADNIGIVALSEMIKHDLTLNELFELDYGEIAEREYVGGEWTISEMEADDD